MSEVGAMADVVSGAVVARAIEPSASDGYTHESRCLNCGTALAGPYCSVCGQHAHVHRTLAAFFHDLAHGVFHFEGKTWRTLPLLALHPGRLTRDYIDGKRASFVSPIALFLFTVFLMFAALGSNFGGDHINAGVGSTVESAANDQRALIEKLGSERDAALTAGKPVARLDAQIASEISDLKLLQAVRQKKVVTFGDGFETLPHWIQDAVNKARMNPDLAFYKVRNSAYKYSWALIPISVPFLWLLFPFSRRFRMYDHTVFVTYSLSFMMMLVIFAGLLTMIGAESVASVLALIPPFHLYSQLKGSYGLSRFGTLWRTVLLSSFAFIAAVIFALMMMTLGVLD